MAAHPTVRSWRSIAGAVLTTLVTALAAVLVPAAARADVPPQPVIVKPTTGWQADWHFTDAHNWTYNMAIMSGAFMAGTGYDGNDLRTFTGTLTDTTPDADRCAYLTFAEVGGSQTYVACNGSITFSQIDPTPSAYTFTLVLRNASNMWRATSYMIVPSTEANPELRASGNGAHWQYDSPTHASFGIVRPGASVVGVANDVGSTFRNASATTVPSDCTVSVLTDEAVERASQEACGRGSVTMSPTELYRDFEIRNCYLTAQLGRPPAQLRVKCVPLIVM